MFAAITFRPDILYDIINLSQYNTNPVRINYVTVKRVFHYLRDKIDDGLHYWSTTFSSDLTDLPASTLKHYTYTVEIPNADHNQPIGYVDYDRAGDKKHHLSISGTCLCFVGAPVVYWSRFQPTISQINTEAEFIVAVKAGKLALYLRLMLDGLGIT